VSREPDEILRDALAHFETMQAYAEHPWLIGRAGRGTPEQCVRGGSRWLGMELLVVQRR
jgi:hypothetical protein